MAGRVIDISSKLKFEDNPRIIVCGKELEVNTDASAIIEIMGMMHDQESVTAEAVLKMCDLIFTDEAKEKIENMHLKWDDYQILVETAIDLATGEAEEEGNPQTPDMT